MAEDPKTPAAKPPAETEDQADSGERIGTILMAAGIVVLAVVLADLAFKGRLLAPLFALFPAPRSSTTPEEAPGGGAELPPDD